MKDGSDDILKHAWFADLDFAKLEAYQHPAPFKPPVKGDDDLSCYEEQPDSTEMPPKVLMLQKWRRLQHKLRKLKRPPYKIQKNAPQNTPKSSSKTEIQKNIRKIYENRPMRYTLRIFCFCISVFEGDFGCVSGCVLGFGGVFVFCMGGRMITTLIQEIEAFLLN